VRPAHPSEKEHHTTENKEKREMFSNRHEAENRILSVLFPGSIQTSLPINHNMGNVVGVVVVKKRGKPERLTPKQTPHDSKWGPPRGNAQISLLTLNQHFHRVLRVWFGGWSTLGRVQKQHTERDRGIWIFEFADRDDFRRVDFSVCCGSFSTEESRDRAPLAYLSFVLHFHPHKYLLEACTRRECEDVGLEWLNVLILLKITRFVKEERDINEEKTRGEG
jgi:hypothetical protein